MHSRSKEKVIENMKILTEQEAFRAYFQAMRQDDIDLAVSILMRLDMQKRCFVQKTFHLYMAKLMALDACLISKATLAVGFYNLFVAKMLKLLPEAPEIGDGADFMNMRLHEQDNWVAKIKHLDKETKGALKLKEFDDMEKLNPFFDFWMLLAEKL